jgi:hypothetical protein
MVISPAPSLMTKTIDQSPNDFSFFIFVKPLRVIRKFFLRDKNYILEQAQLAERDSLLNYLVDFVKVQYLLQHNPLGLEDETVERIHAHAEKRHERLYNFYLTLMGVFRYQYYPDNQLEFIFEDEEPLQRYRREWNEEFRKWVRLFSTQKNFLMGILELTVFYPEEAEARFIGTRLHAFLSDFFEVRFHARKGIVRKMA